MSDDRSRLIAKALRKLAEEVEKNPSLIFNDKNEKKEVYIDIFQIYANGGELSLRNEIEKLDIEDIKNIIRKNSFDSSKLAIKWKNKERLVDLIINKVSARSDKGKVFMG
ncbi:hypothetical protein EPN87_04405 [archaeon]|nr:MAG: hypothetical protein EPN87_04405 [archaeon]